MLSNYLLTGIRNLWKNKGINITNIVGLSLALSCCILEYCLSGFLKAGYKYPVSIGAFTWLAAIGFVVYCFC